MPFILYSSGRLTETQFNFLLIMFTAQLIHQSCEVNSCTAPPIAADAFNLKFNILVWLQNAATSITLISETQDMPPS